MYLGKRLNHKGISHLLNVLRCALISQNLSDLLYATAEPEEKYRYCSTTQTKSEVVQELVAYHANEQILVIGQYITQLDALSETLGVPLIKGDTPVKERERLFAAFRTGEITCLVVSKVANFSIDLPDATIAIQVSGAFRFSPRRSTAPRSNLAT